MSTLTDKFLKQNHLYMKKNLLLSMIIVFLGTSLIAQTVPEVQRTLLTKISATWCNPCGDWGWDMFENLLEDNQDKSILIVAHHSGDLMNVAASEITTNFSVFNQPVFVVNHTNDGVTSANALTKRTEIKNLVDSTFMASPIANAGMDLTLDGDQLQVAIKTKFFQDDFGVYYISAYVVENYIVNYQESIGFDAVHQKVLRSAVTSTTFGDELINGSVTAGTEFDNTYSMTLDSEWNTDNLEVITIIWKKVANKFEFVNANISTDFETTVASVDVLLQNASLNVFPTVTATSATVSIDAKENLENASLELYDLNGRKVADIFQGNLNTGNTTFTIDKKMVNANGIYFLVLKHQDKVASQKVIFE